MIITSDKNTERTEFLRLDKTVVEFSDTISIHAKPNSHLKVILFQNLDPTSDLNLSITTQADKGAQIDLIQFHLGGSEVKSIITQNADEDSEINTDLLCRAKNKQRYQFEIKNVYLKKNGRGKILAKGASLDSSQITMNGGIDIGRHGGGTDAHLKQDCLLLSRDAKIHATPGLQIDTNDVKAGHGASVTNLDDESLFYLTSRGIEEKEARKMLINGFVAEQLDKICELPELKEEIYQLI